MLKKCPKCNKETTFSICDTCKIETLETKHSGGSFPMELKTDKDIEKTSKKQVKKLPKNFDLTVLSDLSNGISATLIAQNNHISMQRLSYYLSKLKKRNLIYKVGYAVWGLTEEGKKRSSNFLHNTCPSRSLEFWHSGYQFNINKKINISGFKKYKIWNLVNDVVGKSGYFNDCFVHITEGKANNTIEITLPYIQSDDSAIGWQYIMNKVNETKKLIEQSSFAEMTPIRRMVGDIVLRKVETNTLARFIVKNVGRVKTGEIEVDVSKYGTIDHPDLEVKTPEDADAILKTLLLMKNPDFQNIPSEVRGLSEHIVKQTEVMTQFAINMETHVAIMKEIRDGLKESREATIELKEVVKKLGDKNI